MRSQLEMKIPIQEFNLSFSHQVQCHQQKIIQKKSQTQTSCSAKFIDFESTTKSEDGIELTSEFTLRNMKMCLRTSNFTQLSENVPDRLIVFMLSYS
ncbi:unnamed protein product [Paramecium octaurelia]|uniref:Uncharacterized protein n=1 Tax=Paramecium octaurelia TaxID=43137 RepID=A0A8S1XL69_PAROT|nr:unnamed protein product [Paramecium octaurelia]